MYSHCQFTEEEMGVQKFNGGILDSLGMYFWPFKGDIREGQLSLHLGLYIEIKRERIEFFLGSKSQCSNFIYFIKHGPCSDA